MKRILFLLFLIVPLCLHAQLPAVDPVGTYFITNADGSEESGDVNGTVQNAPLRVVFAANPTAAPGYSNTPRYEWTVWADADPNTILLHRMDEKMEYTFTSSGSFSVQLKATFYGEDGTTTYNFPEEGEDKKIIHFSISESRLEFPNAFSPNGDGYNDILRAKSTHKSIISFEAAVFNRWGNKLYSWTNINDGWDGKQGGKTIKDGVYFLVVKAKGADGRDYKIRKTITVITGYNNGERTGQDNE